jgi:regulator of protease activity HflC (stomatin/prohibitin superfamily)
MNGLLIALGVVAVLVLVGLALSVRIVQQYEKGVLFRLGSTPLTRSWPRPTGSTPSSARSWM